VNQHPPAHHPPDTHYDSVVDEPSTEINYKNKIKIVIIIKINKYIEGKKRN
jgi:hypothetical protein